MHSLESRSVFQLHVHIDLKKNSAPTLAIKIGNPVNYHMVQNNWPIEEWNITP